MDPSTGEQTMHPISRARCITPCEDVDAIDLHNPEKGGLRVDSKQFEELVARLASGPSRRDALKGAVGGLLAVVGVSSAADSKDTDKAKKKGAKKDKAKQSSAKTGGVEAEHRRRRGRRRRRGGGGRGGSGGGGGSSSVNINIPYGR
jgi:hypothetical protein